MKGINFFENALETIKEDDFQSLISQLSDAEIIASHLNEVIRYSILFTAIDEESGKLIGMATLTKAWKPTGFFGTLEDVVVDQEYRGRGIGKELVKKVLSRAKELEMNSVDFTSNPERVTANLMYISMGAEKRSTNVYRFKIK